MPRTSFIPKPYLLLTALLGLGSYGHAQLAGTSPQYVPLKPNNPHRLAQSSASKSAPKSAPHKNVANSKTAADKLPPPAERKIDYVTDIHPILRTHCANCHLSEKSKGGLRLDTRELILKGGKSGPAAIPGDSAKSLMIKLVAGVDPDDIMPPSGPPLSKAQIGLLRAWIDQGLDFGKAATQTNSAYRPMLAPRTPALPPVPAGSGITNPIDRLLVPYFKARKITPKAVVDDRTYARRVYLDIIGLLPTPEELQTFLDDKQPNKRALLAQRLLADNKRYAEHWLSFWNDALRNDYAGTGYIDGGRQQITQWLYRALLNNMRYNDFVAELVNPTPESQGFSKGIVWRGTVNASQTPQMQAAQNISQVFLGINLKCASCHDSFISDWKLSDAYGMAGIYADKPLEMVRCDIPTGKVAPVKFIYPELGKIDPNLPRPERLKQLANALTSKRNGRLSRTMVNRIWARFMGRGFIEPTDEMDHPSWNADLLDWLASDFANNGYNLKHLITRIVTSRTYQLPSARMVNESDKKFVFSGPSVRRMTAEQFVDAVSAVTGVWPQTPAVSFEVGNTKVTGKWIWKDADAAKGTDGGSVYLRKVVDLTDKPTLATAAISCDNEFVLYINGKKVASGDDWQKPTAINLAPHLQVGKNTFAVQAINWPDPTTGKGLTSKAPNPGGFLFSARIRQVANGAATQVWDFGSDASWLWSGTQATGWEQPDFNTDTWKPAVELGDANSKPWSAEKILATALNQAEPQKQRVRSALTKADTLTVALGRPNREQVVTSRAATATTLQALELTNGRTLSKVLQQGAQQWMAEYPNSSRDLITNLYQRALSRQPTADELKTAERIVDTPAQQEGVEDLLWIVTMLPEFQLIY